MAVYSIDEAAANLRELVARAAKGETVEIRDGDAASARLISTGASASAPPGREGMRSYGFRGRPDSGVAPRPRKDG